MRLLKLLIPILLLTLAACGSHSGSSAISTVVAQTATNGTFTVSWTAPTQNTDGTPISGTLSYALYEMQPCTGGAMSCTAAGAALSTVANNVAATSVQVTGVPDGIHCYAVQAVEVLPDGANMSSAYSNEACGNMQGSTTPQPSPNAPTAVAVTVG